MPNEQGACPRCVGSGREFMAEVDLSDITEAISNLTAICNSIKDVVGETSDYVKKIYEIVSKGS